MSTSRVLLTTEERGHFQCAIAKRDGRRCFYCGRNFKKRPMRRKTLDHYIPHRIWPGWDVDNLVLACEGCNVAKADALPWPLVWLLLAVYRPDGWELAA
ncbi:HNH endonuclease [Streptomyces sp. NBC_01092]|uniref:HNH endonuclease n=1 Tax=Streptomyces sp. NBC_01092 TaxID=2903748 RepID=UPI0038697B3B|nr:HNH endonuclease [Streptomyces sp. NBC_01092]